MISRPLDVGWKLLLIRVLGFSDCGACTYSLSPCKTHHGSNMLEPE